MLPWKGLKTKQNKTKTNKVTNCLQMKGTGYIKYVQRKKKMLCPHSGLVQNNDQTRPILHANPYPPCQPVSSTPTRLLHANPSPPCQPVSSTSLSLHTYTHWFAVCRMVNDRWACTHHLTARLPHFTKNLYL